MKLHYLASFQLELLSLADSGALVSVIGAVHGMHTEDPMGWLQHQFPDHEFGRSLAHSPELFAELNDALGRYANALGSNDVGVANNGVLFLAAVVNQIMASKEEWTH